MRICNTRLLSATMKMATFLSGCDKGKFYEADLSKHMHSPIEYAQGDCHVHPPSNLHKGVAMCTPPVNLHKGGAMCTPH